MHRHLAVGHINVDIYMRVPRIPGTDESVKSLETYIGPGGAASNYSVAVARLGHRAILYACTGTHPLASLALEPLKAAGVDLSHVKVLEGMLPGIVVILVDETGERTMVSYKGANAALLEAGPSPELAAEADLLYFASTDPEVVSASGEAIDRARLAAYDPGSRAIVDPEGVRRVAGLVDMLFVNRRELHALTGSEDPSSARMLLGGRLSRVIVKYGARGVYLVEPGGLLFQEAYRPGPAVDTTGAGDAFAAAFNVYLLETGDPAVALRAGVAAAGIKVTRRGAQSSPTRSEVEDLVGASLY